MEVLIRTLQMDDYKAIGDLIRNELGYSNLTAEEAFKRIDAIISRKDYQTFVAVHNSRVVGFVGVCRGIAFNIDGEYLQIIALAVKKEYQDKGIGSQLLDKIEQYAHSENIVTLGVNSGLHREKTHAFYERRGYLKKGYSFQKSL